VQCVTGFLRSWMASKAPLLLLGYFECSYSGQKLLQQTGAHPYGAHPAANLSAGCAPRGQHRGGPAELSTGFKHGLTDPLGRERSPKSQLETPLQGVPRPLPRSAPQMAFEHRPAPGTQPHLVSRDCSGRLYARSARHKQLSGTQTLQGRHGYWKHIISTRP